ncbi:phosphate transport system regulatory protein PhoU [Pseudoramibacter alactolyticus ATCC 23263]|uniref:Phosphate-specific transport system accessory protein PhoU n=1 Tax=Pseudoramibacter alactolyticus ATCC 23263 TaxID=887929 RepID=E6MDR0_9FIRM|nr:phosphate signaling complex protein PhoU [Pseudoramibacter alactolyticus]EFV02669.1 phosphate transport system regulatory protein PhoU [Pseudoramibacter alactolyticus ATCC 23263]
MRHQFDRELETLNNQIIQMGALCEHVITKAVKVVQGHDGTAAQEALAEDADIDRMERDIERQCLSLLLSQQPVAKDLRMISSALKMITDMERIGDQATDISEIAMQSDLSRTARQTHIEAMGKAVTGMVRGAVDAYVRRDAALAVATAAQDDVVDAQFTAIQQELIALIEEKAIDGAMALDVLMVAKYLERIGDHACNIAEWVRFAVTGKHEKLG